MSTMENAASMLERIGSGVLPAPGEANKTASELRALAAQCGEPHGYAYRYPSIFGDGGTVLLFNGGGEVNGGKPVEAVPYWLGAPPSQPVATDRERGIWRAAITLANNICVQECDRENSNDGDTGWIDGTAECAKRIREWVDPDDDQLAEMLGEAGVVPAQPSKPVALPDQTLCRFYGVDSWEALVAAQEEHVLKLQDAARRNVKPWEDTFPPTLLPKYLRDSGLAAAPAGEGVQS